MKKVLVLISLLSINAFSNPTYNSWSKILNSYVCKDGVDYISLKEDVDLLQNCDAEFKSMTKNKFDMLSVDAQLAWLINLYNFYTLQLIVDNLPLKTGIRDISKPWDKKIVPLFSKNVSLNHIEHEIIRKKYKEPEIHFALVCASKGCPALSKKLYTESNLKEMLNKQGELFLKDSSRNRVDKKKLYLSEIFSWYGGDFKERYGSYKKYILQTLKLEGKYSVKFIPYDWSLNSVDGCK